MQILLFITMLLMMMSIATATRFNLFILSSSLRHAYTQYIHQDFFDFYNKKQRGKYDSSKDTPTPQIARQAQPRSKSSTSADEVKVGPVTRINVRPLFDSKLQTPAMIAYAANIKTLLTRFIESTYAEEAPFKEAFKRMSVETFVNEMIEGGNKPICGKSVSSAADLSSIPFQNQAAREIFYWMMVGGGIEKRYPPLLSFFEWRLGTPPINMYAAPAALVRAIYRNNSHQVDLFLTAREELNVQINQTDASEELRREKAKTWGALFNMEVLTGFPESFLDFTIGKSDPGEG